MSSNEASQWDGVEITNYVGPLHPPPASRRPVVNRKAPLAHQPASRVEHRWVIYCAAVGALCTALAVAALFEVWTLAASIDRLGIKPFGWGGHDTVCYAALVMAIAGFVPSSVALWRQNYTRHRQIVAALSIPALIVGAVLLQFLTLFFLPSLGTHDGQGPGFWKI